MKIHLPDGTVSFDRGSIGPQLDTTTFLASRLGEGSETILSNGAFVTFRFQPERGITGAAVFQDGRLYELSLLLQLPTDDVPRWTEEHELARKRAHDEWLRAELGVPPYRYPWGEVASVFDPKGCVSNILVHYAN